jgi:hypothetical protein
MIRCETCKQEPVVQHVLPDGWLLLLYNISATQERVQKYFCSSPCLIKHLEVKQNGSH